MKKNQEKIINNTKNRRFVFSQRKSNIVSLAIIFLIAGIIAFKENIIYLIIYFFIGLIICYVFVTKKLEVHFYDDFFITKPILGNKYFVYSYEDIEEVIFNKSGFRGGSLLKFTFRDNTKIKTLTYNKSILEPKDEFRFLRSKNVKCKILHKGEQKQEKDIYR